MHIDFSNLNAAWHSGISLAKDAWIVGAILGTLVASFLWILTLSKLDLSVAYPFSVLSYVAVVLISHFFLNEHITLPRMIGVALICIGILMLAKK